MRIVLVLALASAALVGCSGGGDSDAVKVPVAATQGGPSNVNPKMKGAMGNGGAAAPISGTPQSGSQGATDIK